MKLLFLSLFVFPLSTHAAVAGANLTSPSVKGLTAKVLLTEVPEGIKITADVSGLKPGSVHGFHVHESGKCDAPDFESAGGHFNPAESKHGGPASGMKHMGDLGNLVVDKKGIAKAEVIMKTNENNSLRQFIGKSVIIHEKADDLQSQPSGDSGDRIACGIISQEGRP